MEALVTWHYFGFHPNRLYGDIYAVGYNEFLHAVGVLRDTLLAEFPELVQQKEVQHGCDQLLSSYSHSLDEKWFQKFIEYCTSNVFAIPAQISVFSGMNRPEGEEEEEEVEELNHKLLATLYLNFKLKQRINLLDREKKRREMMLERVKKEEDRLGLVLEAQGLERELKDREDHLLGTTPES